jgi:hypothetical protein
MDALRDRLVSWIDAGLISAEQGTRIAEFERVPDPAGPGAAGRGGPAAASGSSAAAAVPAEPRPPRRRSVTSPAEAIGYVGAALALGAIALILGDLWQELLVVGRLALVGVLTLVMFGAGLAVRTASSPAMQRLTSVLFAATVAGTGWFASVLSADVIELSWRGTQNVAALAMVAVAVPLYLRRPRGLPQLVALGSLLFAATSALTLSPLEPGPQWYGLVIGSLGAAWFLLGVGRWLKPTLLAEIAGALLTFLGIQVASFGDPRTGVLVLGLVVAGALVAVAVRTDVLHHLVIGALALFVLSPQLVFELFGDAIGAPATLLLVGLLLVLLAVGLGRARREVVRDPSPRKGDPSPDTADRTDLEEAGDVR